MSDLNPEFIDIIVSESGKSIVVNDLGRATYIPERDLTNRRVAFWGDNNLFPQDVLKDIEKDDVLSAAIERKQQLLYSQGIEYGYITPDEKGGDKFNRVIDLEIENWIKKANYHRTLISQINDFYHFTNCFPEIILSEDRKTILNIAHQEATDCRWERRDPVTGMLFNCFINAQWEIENENDANTRNLPVIDTGYDRVNSLKMRDDDTHYIYPVSFPSPRKKYYQLASWNSIRKSGWLEQARMIPKVKNAIITNLLGSKYIIYVPEYWWRMKYGDIQWEKFKPEEKLQKQREEIDRFEQLMSGPENAGKSIMITLKNDPTTFKMYEGWKIEELNKKVKDGEYIQDSQEAVAHILFSQGLPAALLGNSPSTSGMGAGSGSDVREYFNLYMGCIESHVKLILEPFEFVAMYNGWDEKFLEEYGASFHVRFKKLYMQTQNEITPSKRQTTDA